MTIKEQIVDRDSVYVGEVVNPYVLFENSRECEAIGLYGDYECGDYRRYRSILFTLDEHNLAIDLLYSSPRYPVLNISDIELCKTSEILIKDACNLSELLEYFGYDKILTLDSIKNIRKTFFSDEFVKDNCKLFGFKEFKAQDMKFYKNEQEITGLKRLLKVIRYRQEQLAGHRMFGSIGESPLPREYWDVLNRLSDNTLIDIVNGYAEKIDAFYPHKEEGYIKKLK